MPYANENAQADLGCSPGVVSAEEGLRVGDGGSRGCEVKQKARNNVSMCRKPNCELGV